MNKLIIRTSFWLTSLFAFGMTACAQSTKNDQQAEKVETINTTPMENKMKIEIWSDVMCPFCFIGKRNFETALAQFPNRDHVEVIWKSYQLDPSIPEVADENYHDYLVKRKNMSSAAVKNMLANVVASAKEVGLDYNFDKAIMVNSLSAHKLIQFAKTKGLGDQAEEKLFLAFFTEGKDIADLNTLTQLGKEIGLDEAAVKAVFTDDKYTSLVQHDIQEGQQIGVQGVPFFVLDRKYAVSGAQPPQAFLQNLEQSFSEWRKLNPENNLKITQGQSCKPDGSCE